ncbi:hypothetical protein ABBQ32_002646 [Trebouxia sp. C0010 RCD-2024]
MLCQPRSGDFSRWTDRLVQSRSLFVHISGSSGVLDGCLPEGNGHLPCNPKKKKKFGAYIGRATMEQACCPYACCSSPNQPQTISHMFLECPMAATVIGWLCRLWQAVTGHLPDASVATILVASTSEGHCASDALLQTWHRLRLAVLHSIWTAARIAASSTHTSTQASQSSSQSHLASKLALKTIVSMIRHDWVKCTDDVRQLSGVCSSWLRGRDPSMTLQAFRDLWCHHDALASIHTAHTGTEDKLELMVNLSDMACGSLTGRSCVVTGLTGGVLTVCAFRLLFFFFFFFFWVTGEMSIPFRQAAVKAARRT